MKLLFIYNANSGKLNALLDTGHKLLSPLTYKCKLCALTFDTFVENKAWKTFRQESKIAMEFYHKDEFEQHFPNINMIYPIVLKLENNELSVQLTTDVLNETATVEALIDKIKTNL